MNVNNRRASSLRLVALLATASVAAGGLQACGGGGDDAAPPPAAALTLADCFGVQARVTPGVTMTYDYQSTSFDPQGNATTLPAASWTQFTNDGVVFQGAPRSEFVLRVADAVTAGSTSESEIRTYLSGTATTLTVFGDISRSVFTSAGTTIVEDSTSVESSPEPIDLAVGVAGVVTVTSTTATTTTVTTNGVVAPATTATTTSTGSITFVDVETITVPAGTYSTCRLRFDDTSDNWFIPGTAVVARAEGYNANGGLAYRFELLTLARNGAPF